MSSSEKTTATELLPVRAVTLFASGVCYTLREGEVPGGDASIALTFRTPQINDILKSLVLLDEAGGVQAATYPSRDPVGRTLQSFAVDVTDNRSRADLLRGLRGAPVRVETTGGETLTGRIVGVETQEEIVGERERTLEVLSLLTDEGLAAVALERVKLLRLLDERLDREFREALTVLASGSDDNWRSVTLRFTGENARPVRVGYITESPIWKVSYRLVLEEEADSAVAAKPYLQGWAMVENTSDEDWNDIRLSLVSGRPVSFIQDLYQPLYVPRPVVAPDIIASPYPQQHGGIVEEYADLSEPMVGAPAPPMAVAASAPAPASGGAARGKMRAAMGSAVSWRGEQERGISSSVRNSTSVQAEGQGAGELFEYHIGTPVTLPRQQAAMIPIVAEEVGGRKVSLYNPITGDARHPWNAIQLKNNTSLHLKGGPVTVFDGGIYAGDARMEDIPPGDTRLLTYAIDLALLGEKREEPTITLKTTLTIRRGVMQLKHSRRQQIVYTLRNKGKTARRVLIEHPVESGWFVRPIAERTADWYRFPLTIAPGQTNQFTVTQLQPTFETIALLNANMNTLITHSNGASLTTSFRDALTSIVQRRQQIQERDSEANARERERTTIGEEQERIRANMAALDRDTPLYRRYLEELDKQETRLQTLRAETDQLRTEAQRLTVELQTFVDGLNIDEQTITNENG